MPRLVRNRTLNDLEDAVFALQDAAAVAGLPACAGDGCCGCGRWAADVTTNPDQRAPAGETYCWRCVDRLGFDLDEYVVLPGRER